MLRIRKISDVQSDTDRAIIREVQHIIAEQFPGLAKEDIEKLPDQIENPMKHKFVADLFVSETSRGTIKGFALLLHDPDLKFAFLELISVAPGATGGGQGAALYTRARESAQARGAKAIYFECLPDEPALSPDAKTRRQNAARLKFYEQFGAFPILGTGYETPIAEGTTDSPYLVVDLLGKGKLPSAAELQQAVRAILERKYAKICPPGYIDGVIASIKDGAFHLRPPRYSGTKDGPAPPAAPPQTLIPLIVNDRHNIHHVRERGYVESPVRINSILGELDKTGLFKKIEPKHFGDRHITQVHDGGLVDYIERACAEAPENKSIYPYVFPIRNPSRKPKERSVLAGYWCIDTFTPLNRNAYPAARRAVDCALTAAQQVLDGAHFAYALVRPPGHHAERKAFGGFCYFNNAAIAANYLSEQGRVAVLDIDYHHGNGTQDIFYERQDVLTVSVHGHPSFAYPYFTGFAGETGRGAGAGYNLNIPLNETISAEEHRAAVGKALTRIARHDPAFLVLAIGFDTAAGDPTGTWPNRAADFEALGRMIGEAGYPTVVVQEGGYRVRTIGTNARHFFKGLAAAVPQKQTKRAAPRTAVRGIGVEGLDWREAVSPDDIEKIKKLVAATNMFISSEVEIAGELVEERIQKGRASGYEFIIAESGGRIAGYACYGKTAGTDASFDLYWIAVTPSHQNRGLGHLLLSRVEDAIRAEAGRYLYVDTSSTEKYVSTRKFYQREKFKKVAELTDFYREGDGKVIFRKDLGHAAVK